MSTEFVPGKGYVTTPDKYHGPAIWKGEPDGERAPPGYLREMLKRQGVTIAGFNDVPRECPENGKPCKHKCENPHSYCHEGDSEARDA